MENILSNLSPTMWWASLASVMVGVFLAIFKNTLISFFSELIKDRRLYINRRFDEDGDPATGEFCSLTSKTDDSNQFLIFVSDHKWDWFNKFQRGVVFFQKIQEDRWLKKTMPYAVWRTYDVCPLPEKRLDLDERYKTKEKVKDDFERKALGKV